MTVQEELEEQLDELQCELDDVNEEIDDPNLFGDELGTLLQIAERLELEIYDLEKELGLFG